MENQSAFDIKGISAADAETLQNERAKALREARRLETESQSQVKEFTDRYGGLRVVINSPHQVQCRGDQVAITIAPTPQSLSLVEQPGQMCSDGLIYNAAFALMRPLVLAT